MQRSVEATGYNNKGVFFDVVNKAADTDVVITALEAGAYGGVRRATLWVCGRGARAWMRDAGGQPNEHAARRLQPNVSHDVHSASRFGGASFYLKVVMQKGFM